MNLNIAKVVYEARRSQLPLTVPGPKGKTTTIEPGAPFEELTSAEREPLLAEVQAALQSGEPMKDLLGQAIVDALK